MQTARTDFLPKSRFLPKLATGLLCLLLPAATSLAGCQAGPTPAGTSVGPATTPRTSSTAASSDTPPNRLPLKASLEFGKLENESFSTQAVKGAYALNAVLTGAWVTTVTSLLLAGPALVVGKASEQDASCNKTAGNWQCDWDSVPITGDLRARAFGSKSLGAAPDFTFSFSGNFMGTRLSDYEGLLCQDCSWESGTWTAHDLKAKAQAMTLNYRFTGDGDKDFEPGSGESADLTLTLTRKIGELPAGSSVRYRAEGDQRNLSVTNGANGGSRVITWDESSKAGRISIKETASAKTEVGCWDAKGSDIPCS